jgi:ABC-type transporter Mla maintaining outer membrane lipid asymmetry ATPase subunit MlaF
MAARPLAPDASPAPLVRVEGLTMAFGEKVVQRDLSFAVQPGEILVLMGGSGCGKSTLLRHLIGLQARPPATSTTATSTWPKPTRTSSTPCAAPSA